MADLAQEVVQEVQRERIVGLAVDDARVRAAEARAGQAGAALHAAPTGLAQRAAALDDAKAEPTRGSGPPTNATAWPTSRCVADQEDRTTALGPRLRLGLAPRPVPRAVLLAVRPCRVGWDPTLQQPLDQRAARRDGTTHRYSRSSRATSAQAVCWPQVAQVTGECQGRDLVD